MEAVAAIAKFLALNALTGVAALALASRCGLASRAERLLAACILFTGVALASGFALGLTGTLRFWPLLSLQAAAAMVAGFGARWAVVADTFDQRTLRGLFDDRWLRVGAACVGVAYLYVAVLGLVSEPFSGDALMYHLPLTAAFAREGRIIVPQLGAYWHTDWWAYHPANAYLLYQWWVLPFGSGVVADLVQLPYAAGTALATFVLARLLGADRGGAVWGALLFLAVPIVVNQAKTALVDITLTFLFTAGLTMLVTTPLTTSRLLLGAIAWGALPGAKLSGIIYLAAGVGCVILHLASTIGMRALLRRLAVVAVALGVAVVLLSSYWFVRNYEVKGSAIFPLSVSDAQDLAWSNILAYGPLIPILDFTVYPPMFFYNYETGAGVQFAGLALPAAAALAVAALRRRRFGVAATALLPLIMYPFWLVSHSREPHTIFRFVLPAMPAGFAAAGWFLGHAPRRRWLTALAAGSVVFSIVNAVPHVGSFTDPQYVRTGLAQLMLGTHRLGRFDRMGDLAIGDYRRAWHYLDDLPGPHEIDAAHLIFSYPLLGADFRHRVHFLEAGSRTQWLAAMRAAHIDHVALAQLVDPSDSVGVQNGHLELSMHVRVTGDEYVAALHALEAPLAIRGVRIRYAVPSPSNARVVLGLNRFADTVELPLDMPTTEREHTVEWTGELTSLELFLGFVPRTRLRDDIAVDIASIDLLPASGDPVPMPLGAEQWTRAAWPLEYYWMENEPAQFHLVLRDRDYGSSSYSGEMRIYAVMDGKGS